MQLAGVKTSNCSLNFRLALLEEQLPSGRSAIIGPGSKEREFSVRLF